jgi:glycosyltransferase involved in cell wall biosynthesis
MSDFPTTLSVMEDILGHRTYGQIMRNYFAKESPCNKIDFYWFKDERKLVIKLLARPLHTFFPNRWIQKENLDFSRFRIQIAMSLTARSLVTRKLKQKEYSLLHLHTQGISLLLLDYIKKIPTIVSLDITAIQASREKTSPIFRWTYLPNIWLEKQVYNASRKIISFSNFAKESLVQDYKINEQKIVVIPPGINIKIIEFYDREKRLESNSFRILFIGNDFKRKGGEVLLNVFLSSFSGVAELHLVTKESINVKHPNIQVHNNIEAYTSEWLRIYQQSDVFVMPTYSEAFGHVFLEAMAAGLPVIATNINAIPEMIIHGKTGFLIKPGDQKDLTDKIQALIMNPNLRWEMGKQGRIRVEQKFNIQHCFRNLEQAFREACHTETN